MKKKIYLFITLLTILSIILLNLTRNRIKNVKYIIFFGSEKQKEKMYTPLVEEKFDFSKLGNKKAYKISPYYFGSYMISLKITDDISKSVKEIQANYSYLINCIKIKISIEDKIIFEKIFKEKDALGVYTSRTSTGLILAYFEIKEEDLNKKIIMEVEVVNTNDNLIKYINEKTIRVKAGGNL